MTAIYRGEVSAEAEIMRATPASPLRRAKIRVSREGYRFGHDFELPEEIKGVEIKGSIQDVKFEVEVDPETQEKIPLMEIFTTEGKRIICELRITPDAKVDVIFRSSTDVADMSFHQARSVQLSGRARALPDSGD